MDFLNANVILCITYRQPYCELIHGKRLYIYSIMNPVPTLEEEERKSEAVNRRRTDNTMTMEKVQKYKQWSTKKYMENCRLSNPNLTNNEVEVRCISGTLRIALRNLVIGHE